MKKKDNTPQKEKHGKNAKQSVEQEQKEGELLEALQRLQAEFENYKKRMDAEQVRSRELATEGVITELIPIIDNFSIALRSHENKEDEFYKGIEIIYAQILELFKTNDVETIDCSGKFDPRLHEAMLTQEDTDKEENTIIEVLQEGYSMKGKVLRHAKVSVSKVKK
ncbi:nucleotide exchange factor GrpE [Candidatus Woesearchaeota archaeon]|nr:nucleotide exchange factor GrpE [Candidatus Woesearchaeota archaeon]